jgi:hypothetical protein
VKDNIFVLLLMIFLHIVDDFKLQQGVLANLKQKNWWRNQQEYKDVYKYDHIPALVLHAFSWSFMIMLPIAVALHFDLGYWFIAYLCNMIIHAIVDDLKANKFKINLVTDQFIHIIQIFTTWLIFVLTR